MEWISVEKRLPEIGKDVFIVLVDDTILMGRLLHDGWCAFWKDGYGKVYNERSVSHWMPLPELPKQ